MPEEPSRSLAGPSAGGPRLFLLPGARAKERSRFQLLRYFGITSLIGVLVVLGVLVYFYRYFALEALERHETQDNVSITKNLETIVWPQAVGYVRQAAGLPKDQLRSNPEVARIRAEVLRQMSGLFVVRVKIYDLNGLTVFSTDERQIGEDESDDDGFQDAKSGQVISEIVFANHFDSFDQAINDRNLISTYIPIWSADHKTLEGVFEVYSDVTPYVAELGRATWKIVGIVLASLSTLYAFLYIVVRRADHTIRDQAVEVEDAHQAMLAQQALHDALTGLPNRDNLFKRLDLLIRSGGAPRFAVLYAGLDGFKEINDSFGHLAGDGVLKEMARRLVEQFPAAVLIARVGGDELALVMDDAKGGLAIEQIAAIVDRIKQAIAATPVVLQGQDLAVTASIGIALYPEDGADVGELLKSADSALSHAKKQGRSSHQFHTVDMNIRVFEMLRLERELQVALNEDQFVLYYQPQMDIRTGAIVGAEALIRWQHPQHGLVGPGRFIHLAEERGLIVAIGAWVIRQACVQLDEWQKQGLAPVPVAVNLSAQHFKLSTLAADVVQTMAARGTDPRWLEFELTESSVMQDAETTIETMQALKSLGATLALDDFGTGFSSLSQLKRLPLDNLKLDQSFVRGLPADADDLAICTAVLAMGKALGLRVIAEGVETREQLAVLHGLGCDVVQGYLMARPMPADQFLAFARAYQPAVLHQHLTDAGA